MRETVYQIVGQKPGPVSVILGGTHGDERCGVEALDMLTSSLEIDSGIVYLLYGNPRAIDANVRYVEVNLNRVFNDDLLSEADKNTYEYKRAQFIKQYLDKADVLLDLHASSVPDSRAFAICSSIATGIVEYLPIDTVVTGFDEVEPGATDDYMGANNKVGICLECGFLGDKKSTDLAISAVYDFLKVRGHVDGFVDKKTQEYINMYKKYYSKTDNFKLVKQFENFENLDSGQKIGVDGGNEVFADKDCVILFAHNGHKVGDEVFLLGQKKNSLA